MRKFNTLLLITLIITMLLYIKTDKEMKMLHFRLDNLDSYFFDPRVTAFHASELAKEYGIKKD